MPDAALQKGMDQDQKPKLMRGDGDLGGFVDLSVKLELQNPIEVLSDGVRIGWASVNDYWCHASIVLDAETPERLDLENGETRYLVPYGIADFKDGRSSGSIEKLDLNAEGLKHITVLALAISKEPVNQGHSPIEVSR